MSFSFSPADRPLLIMPHPDDESLATGGLIQRIRAGGASARLLMVTRGENNPWPQRWMEKRWRIGPSECARWGALREEEARVALERLGFPGEARFLGFPDQGMTPRLLAADPEPLERFRAEICAWQPTCVIAPSAYDLHPDHNALHVLVQLALERAGCAAIPQFHFVVHCKHPERIPRPLPLHLTEEERAAKREAILCHTTQMVLSRKRFCAYARPGELYFGHTPAEAAEPHPRIPEASLSGGLLRLSLALPPLLRFGASLWIAGETPTSSIRWRIRLPAASGKASVEEIATGHAAGTAAFHVAGHMAQLEIPAPAAFTRLFVKFQRPTVFLDDSGWREAPVGNS